MDLLNVTYAPGKAPAPSTPEQRKAMDLAVEFETFFMYQMLELAGNQETQDGIFGESFGGSMYQQMMNEELAKGMAGNTNIGLADAVYRQLITEQERTFNGNEGE